MAFNAEFISTEQTFNAGFSTGKSFDSTFDNTVEVGRTDPYIGEYEFTPGDSIQIINIQGKTAQEDIIINPIPQNYGLITWDGTAITIS